MADPTAITLFFGMRHIPNMSKRLAPIRVVAAAIVFLMSMPAPGVKGQGEAMLSPTYSRAMYFDWINGNWYGSNAM